MQNCTQANAERLQLIDNQRLKKKKEKSRCIDTWVEKLESERAEGQLLADQVRRERTQAAFPKELAEASAAIQEEVFYRVAFKLFGA